MLLSNHTIIILFAVSCAALAAALPDRRSYARLASRSLSDSDSESDPARHHIFRDGLDAKREWCRVNCCQGMVEGSIELGICIDGCLNSEYSGDHPSFPRVLCHQTPPPSGSPMDLDEQDPEKFRPPCKNVCGNTNSNGVNCVELCMAGMAMRAGFTYKPILNNIDVPKLDKKLGEVTDPGEFRRPCELENKKNKKKGWNWIEQCIAALAKNYKLPYEPDFDLETVMMPKPENGKPARRPRGRGPRKKAGAAPKPIPNKKVRKPVPVVGAANHLRLGQSLGPQLQPKPLGGS